MAQQNSGRRACLPGAGVLPTSEHIIFMRVSAKTVISSDVSKKMVARGGGPGVVERASWEAEQAGTGNRNGLGGGADLASPTARCPAGGAIDRGGSGARERAAAPYCCGSMMGAAFVRKLHRELPALLPPREEAWR